jgi:AcrR family transcriptional regulator
MSTATKSNQEWPVVPKWEPPPEIARWTQSRIDRYGKQHRALLASARKFISERDYDEILVLDLVTAAQMSKRSFYEHFASKDHCFAEAYRQVSGAVLRGQIETVEAMSGARDDEVIAAVLRAQVGMLRSDPVLATELQGLTRVGGPVLAGELSAAMSREEQFIRVLARRLKSMLPDRTLRMAASVLVRAGVMMMPDLARDARYNAKVNDLASVWCGVLGLSGGVGAG